MNEQNSRILVQFKFLCISFVLVRLNSIVVEGSPLSRRFRSECKFQTIRVFQTTSEKVPALCCENVPNPLLGVEISQRRPSHGEDLIRNRRAKAKVAKARRERRPLTSGQTARAIHRLMRRPSRRLQVSLLVLSVDTRGGNRSRNRLDNSRNPTKLGANAVDAELGERIDLTIDSGCVACALPVGVASAIGMQQLSRTAQEYIANAEKIREIGFKTPTLKFQNGDVHNLKFSVMDKLHKPLVAACKVVAAGDRIVRQPENQGASFIKGVRSKRKKRIFERSGVHVLPCWVVKQNSQKRLAPLVKSWPND